MSETDVASTLQQLIDDLPEQIALLDEECLIVAANEAWKNTAEEHGFPEVMPGHNYRDFCATRAVQGYEPAIEALAALDDFRAGKRSFWQLVYNGRDSWRGRDYQITLHRIWLGGRNLISVTRFDLTEILRLRRAKDDFTTSLIEGQAFERQRMGREIHDSTSQLLAAIGLILGRLRQQLPESEALGLVEEMQELLTDVHGEIRSISYLAHPPSLKKLGLADAVKSLVEGFGRRTGLETSFDIHGDSVPMSASAESMIYRLAQEALSNIYRHAHATRVRLQLRFRRSTAHFVVADDGIGISQETLAGLGGEGVGLASMRSRLAELGGRLSIRTLSPGVAIIASVPSP
ncbi:MAG TPA: sensor histidine kinase [Sphingomicrobium sp.]|nr:sensor histidine kinase [Sphingomicrobium sp.]